ncbi:hypothetical protein AMTRI_Chr01g129670 [Amborella trichopoda]
MEPLLPFLIPSQPAIFPTIHPPFLGIAPLVPRPWFLPNLPHPSAPSYFTYHPLPGSNSYLPEPLPLVSSLLLGSTRPPLLLPTPLAATLDPPPPFYCPPRLHHLQWLQVLPPLVAASPSAPPPQLAQPSMAPPFSSFLGSLASSPPSVDSRFVNDMDRV